jgi:hypothetical protein
MPCGSFEKRVGDYRHLHVEATGIKGWTGLPLREVFLKRGQHGLSNLRDPLECREMADVIYDVKPRSS